jgi:hypothetical protein
MGSGVESGPRSDVNHGLFTIETTRNRRRIMFEVMHAF